MVRHRALGCLLVPLIMFGVATAQTAHRKPLSGSSTSDTSVYKGILESINYGQDIKFTDVFFVSPEVGWVAGEHATILKTTDGGAHWTAQVGGDPSNSEKTITLIRFLDARRGWAIQEDSPRRLLHTTDGEHWDLVNANLPPGVPILDLAFTSERHGIMLGGNGDDFYVTNDGGKSWETAGPCQLSVTADGLAQRPNCHFIKMQMLSPLSGLAFAWWSGSKTEALVIFRTDDGGEHWTYVVPDVTDSRYASIAFTDLDHGVLVFNNDHRTYVTGDGGKTWHASLATSIGPNIAFADPEVGWTLQPSPDNSDTFRISYTSDGGQHWKNSQNIAFPGGRMIELKFALPRRDRAYIVGPHGMIYRYRVVPANYNTANSLPGPLMPGFDVAQLTAASARISSDLQKLQAKLTAAGPPQASAAVPPVNAPPVDTAAGNSGDFMQDVDSSPPSAPLQNCCAAPLQELQADLASFTQVAPATASKYRNLNLAIAGFQLVANLAHQASALHQSFVSLKHAQSLQAASMILQQLASTVNSVQQTVSTGFQDTGAWYASAANSGNFAQPGTTPATSPGSPPPAQPSGFQQDVPAAPANPPATQAGAPPQLQAQQQKQFGLDRRFNPRTGDTSPSAYVRGTPPRGT